MAVDLQCQGPDGIYVGVAHGLLSLQEIKDAAARMFGRVEGARIRVLWDLREAEFDLDPTEVRELAVFVKGRSPDRDLRTAFVVGGDLEFGLARMFGVLRETETSETAVFRDRERAVSWLQG